MSSTASTPRLVHSLPPVYAAAALRLALPLVVLPLVASRVELVVYGAMLLLAWAFATTIAVFLLLQTLASAALAWLGWRWLRADLAGMRPPGARLWSRPQLAPGLKLGWTMMPVAIAGAAYSFALPAAASGRMTKPELGLDFMAGRIGAAPLPGAA